MYRRDNRTGSNRQFHRGPVQFTYYEEVIHGACKRPPPPQAAGVIQDENDSPDANFYYPLPERLRGPVPRSNTVHFNARNEFFSHGFTRIKTD